MEALEQDVAAYSRCQFGIGVSSGSNALLVSLWAIDIKPGDEIITSPHSFFASAGSIEHLGARPIFVDVDFDTFSLDATLIEARVTGRTHPLPLDLRECFEEIGYAPGDCRNAGRLAHETLALPIYSELTLPMIERFVRAVADFYKG